MATVTAANDYQKQLQFERLNAVAEEGARVCARRDGREVVMNITELLVGDVLLLESGDVVPVDAVLIDTVSAEVVVDESHMTGESDDITKSTTVGHPTTGPRTHGMNVVVN